MFYSKDRIIEIDIFRGILILLMIFDHFMLIFFNLYSIFCFTDYSLYYFSNWYLSSIWRTSIRIIVLCLFFIISGICSNFSNNQYVRTIKIIAYSLLFSFITYIISKVTPINCFVICGVLQCYSIYNILYCLKLKISDNKVSLNLLLFLILIAVVFIVNDFKLSNTNALLFIGIPSKNYIAPLEYISPPKFLWAFFVGIYIGNRLYKANKTSLLKKRIPIISTLGEYSIYVYFIHYPFIFCILYLLSLFY